MGRPRKWPGNTPNARNAAYMRERLAKETPEVREKRLQYLRDYHRTHPRESSHLLNRYGLTTDDVDAFVVQQNGLCPICGEALDRIAYQQCVVDHDHDTGRIRGLLHQRCNLYIGFHEKSAPFRDSIERYLNAS